MQKTTVIMMSLDEFTELVGQLTDGLQTVEIIDGDACIVHTEKAEDTDEYINQPMTDILSDHFHRRIVTWHTDRCEYPTVYLMCGNIVNM